MPTRFWLTGLLVLPLLVVALIYGRNITRCQQTVSAPTVTDDSDESHYRLQEDNADTSKQTAADASDPDKQIVFKVEGLRCPAVKGIGCGHLLHPVLADLDQIDGVQASSTNCTGTMLRISVTSVDDRTTVAERVRKALADNKPVALSGDDFKRALDKEQWRETWRVGELSAVEFRAMALYRIKTFAQAEKLDKETTDNLTKMAEEQWERLAREAKKEKATQPEDWGNRCKKSIPAFLDRAKKVLSEEQLERFKSTLTTPCRGDDRPEAPPAPVNSL